MRASWLVRRSWRATVVLTLLAGLAAGVAMTMVAAGRRTATVYDRFFEYADVPDLLINFCPPGLDQAHVGLSDCYTYDAVEERAVLLGLPEIEAVARGGFRGLTVAPADRPQDTTMASALVGYDEGAIPSIAGQYLVVDGRDAEGVDEVLLNEVLAGRSGLGVGDRAVLTFWGAEELGRTNEGSRLHGPSVEVEVVGIGRSLTDLASAQGGFSASLGSFIFAPPGLADATREASEFTGVLVHATDDDAQAATAALERALPDQIYNVAPGLAIDEIEPPRDAIRYEAQATTVLGLVIALLGVAFVGQSVARQSRREWSDGPTLRAVGVTTAGATAATLLRSATFGLPAAVVGVTTAVLLSSRGPVGTGRRAEIDPGRHLDLPVLVVGAVLTIAVCALGACVPLVRGSALRTLPPALPIQRARRSFGLPPVASAGLHLARDGRGRGLEVATALASAAAAVVAVVAASTMVASFDDLARTPERFGAPWDVSIAVPLDDLEPVGSLLAQPEVRRSIDQAAVIVGFDLDVGGQQAWVHAYAPLEDVADEALPLPIDEGRPPGTPREIAVGALTLDDMGRSIGDRIIVRNASTDAEVEVTIVGTAMINDTFEASPGRGAVVTPELIAEVAPEASRDPAIVSLIPEADVDAFVTALRSRYGGSVERPFQPAAVRNIDRIRDLPYVMASVVALLAAASLVHALVLSVGRNRRALGMLKGLGFTRRQVVATVAWHATAYAVVASAIALPLGVVAGRWGWRLVTGSLGVPDVAVLPLLAVVAVTPALVLLANLAAAYPGWRAARLSTAAALRSE